MGGPMDSGLRIVDSGLWTTDRTVVIMRLVIFHVSWLKCLFEHGQGPRPRAPLTNSSSFSLLSVFPLFFLFLLPRPFQKKHLKIDTVCSYLLFTVGENCLLGVSATPSSPSSDPTVQPYIYGFQSA